MIYKIINFCQNVNFEFNLYELIMGLSISVLITALIFVASKLMRTHIKQRIIDIHLRETGARIARVVTEIEEFKETKSEAEGIRSKIIQTLGATEFVRESITMQPIIVDAKQIIEDADQNIKEEELPSIQEVIESIPEGKKTRAMSMEERWAEYDKKRSMRSLA